MFAGHSVQLVAPSNDVNPAGQVSGLCNSRYITYISRITWMKMTGILFIFQLRKLCFSLYIYYGKNERNEEREEERGTEREEERKRERERDRERGTERHRGREI